MVSSDLIKPTRPGVDVGPLPHAIKERPILFSGPMVRALLAGRKTQTRRAVKGAALEWLGPLGAGMTPEFVADPANHLCPYGNPGDVLWVRESGALLRHADDHDPVLGVDLWQDVGWAHASDGAVVARQNTDPPLDEWIGDCARIGRPSIHMPRWASRLSLRITDVRIERLRDITDADATAEGVFEPSLGDLFVIDHATPAKLPRAYAPPLVLWEFLWKQINGDASWDANPWVWAVSFEVITPDGVGRAPRPHPVGSDPTVCPQPISADPESPGLPLNEGDRP